MRSKTENARAIQRASAPLDLSHTPWRRLVLSAKRDIWCLVDADDCDWIMQWRWNWGWHNRTPWKFYAKRNVGTERSTIYLHRELMLRAQPNVVLDRVVDHINGQSLDNRQTNLRWVTAKVNRANALDRSQIPSLDAIVAELVAGLEDAEEMPF